MFFAYKDCMKIKCKYADKYKVKRKPKCGCKTCNDKWKNRITLTEKSRYYKFFEGLFCKSE